MGALRRLTVEQQVGLLFVTLFGLLALVTIVAVLRALRDDTDAETAAARRAFLHDLRAVWIGAVLFWIAWASGAFVATLLFALVSFIALREFITLTHTRRGDHRSLIAAFFVVLPVQYVLAGSRSFNLFSVFIPVYAFAALPILGALGNDPTRFLERTAKIQWGTMVCVYGMSHAPALLLLDFPRHEGRGAFLVLFLVLVVAAAQLAQHAAGKRLRALPAARQISRSFTWQSWALGALAGGFVGLLLYWATPFKAGQALFMGFAAPVFFHSVRWYFGV